MLQLAKGLERTTTRMHVHRADLRINAWAVLCELQKMPWTNAIDAQRAPTHSLESRTIRGR